MPQISFTHKMIQGFSVVWTTFIVDALGNPVVFTGSEPLQAEYWSGGQQVLLVTLTSPTNIGFNTASAGTIDITYAPSIFTSVLFPPGYYNLVISRTDTSTALAFGYLS